jgi:3-oxoacyl-(acyl-carrier-protein) synthase
MQLAEGAAAFVLTTLPPPEAQPWAELVSFGFGNEQIPHAAGITEKGENLFVAMQRALAADYTQGPIDLILAHAPGTHTGDAAELAAIRAIFGKEVPPVYSNKWAIGHTLGAAGALSVAQAIAQLGLPPLCLPYANALPAVHTRKVQKILVNAVGFGGVAASLLLHKSLP